MITIGDFLSQHIKKLGLSKSKVARDCGLDEKRFDHYVKNRRRPDYETLVLICKYLKISPNEVLGFECPPLQKIDHILLERIFKEVENSIKYSTDKVKAEQNKFEVVATLYEYVVEEKKAKATDEDIEKLIKFYHKIDKR